MFLLLGLLPNNQPEHDSIYNYEHLTQKDLSVLRLAESSVELLEESGYIHKDDHPGKYGEKQSYIEEYADFFAERYWGVNCIEDVSRYLNHKYEKYPDEMWGHDLMTQLDYNFEFYGFKPVYSNIATGGYDNPYTEGEMGIRTYKSYLMFLLQHYDEMKTIEYDSIKNYINAEKADLAIAEFANKSKKFLQMNGKDGKANYSGKFV